MIRAITHTAALIIGAVLAKWLGDIPMITLDRSIDPVALLGLIFSVLAGAFLYRRFESSKYADQLSKNAVLARILAVRSRLEAVEAFIGSDSPRDSEAAQLIKRCRIDLQALKDHAKAFEFELSETDETKFELRISELNTLLTHTPRLQSPSDPLRVENNVLIMSRDRRIEVETAIRKAGEVLLAVERAVIRKT